ncbi:HAD family hydrolase [Magnetococcales bacterium HHB-1]
MFVFFDIGSTLIDGPPVGPPRRFAEALGLDDTARRKLKDLLFCSPFEHADALAEAMIKHFAVEKKKTRRICQEIWQAQVREAYALPGAASLLLQLREKGIPYAFISNIWSPFYQGFLKNFPKEGRVPSLLSFKTALRKPDPELYRLALKQVDQKPESCVMIGDTYAMDILPAANLGMKTVWLLHRPEKEKKDLLRILRGEAPHPSLTLGDISEITTDQLASLFG